MINFSVLRSVQGYGFKFFGYLMDRQFNFFSLSEVLIEDDCLLRLLKPAGFSKQFQKLPDFHFCKGSNFVST
jgi:hypothetical protein